MNQVLNVTISKKLRSTEFTFAPLSRVLTARRRSKKYLLRHVSKNNCPALFWEEIKSAS